MEKKISKYWFIEFEDGDIAGYESLTKVTAAEVKRYMRLEHGLKVTPYITTKTELYFSEVDIF